VVLGIGSRSWGIGSRPGEYEENRKNSGIREEKRERGDNCTGQYLKILRAPALGYV
jgi:hypothetical protein